MFGLFKTKPAGYENIPASLFMELMKEKSKQAIVIDVRTPSEAASGIIPGARLMNLMDADFGRKMEKMPKEKTVLLYCRSGSRSASAAKMFVSAGFQSVYNLTGGMMSWPYKTVRPSVTNSIVN